MGLYGCSNNEDPPPAEETPSETLDLNGLPDFQGVDLYGNSVTEDVFNEHSLTMVNVWGTFCDPCIREMPDLARLYGELQEKDINLVGIMVDVSEDKNKDLAIQITEDNGVKYLNIIPDDALIDYLYNNISGVPTTLFVDREGNIIGEPVVGARDKDTYMQIAMERLEEAK